MIPYKILQQKTKEAPDQVAFIDADRGIIRSFDELLVRVTRLASGLQRLGIKRTDTVGALLPNCIELVELYIACGAVGAIFQPMDVRFRGTELQNCLNNTLVKILFVWAPLIDKYIEEYIPSQIIRVTVNGKKSDWLTYESILNNYPLKEDLPIDEDNEVALYLYTSGSTTAIKCVPLTWRQLDFFPEDLISIWHINEKDRGLSLLPMSHISGPIVINLCLQSRSSYVITNRFAPEQIARLIKQYEISWTHTVPSIGRMIYQAAIDYGGMESIRLLALMGTTIPPALFDQLLSVIPNAAVVQGYGLTETSPLLTVQRPGWPREKITSIGKPLPHVEIKLVDELDQEVPEGSPGQIIVKGPRVFKGYIGNEALNKKVFRNGWFYTGDIGMKDSEGFYYHIGRVDDVIICGGLKLYPGEVENEILQHPSVAECVVYGQDDALRGKVVVAEIVPRPGKNIDPAQIRTFLANRLASYKIPRIIHQVDSLAYTPVGKPIRKPVK